MKPKGKLTKKEKLFCQEYLKDFNASRAAKDAGYAPDSAGITGHYKLKKTNIREYLEAQFEDRINRIKLDQERILRELEYVAFSRMKNFVEVKRGRVNLIDTDQIETGLDGAVKSYSETITEHGGSVHVALHDKLKALEMLARYVGMDVNKTEKSSSLEELLMASLVKKEAPKDEEKK